MTAANVITTALGLYTCIGFVFALAFVTVGVQRVDAAARDAGIAFRLLIVPGSVALWPLLLRRWMSGVQES